MKINANLSSKLGRQLFLYEVYRRFFSGLVSFKRLCFDDPQKSLGEVRNECRELFKAYNLSVTGSVWVYSSECHNVSLVGLHYDISSDFIID